MSATGFNLQTHVINSLHKEIAELKAKVKFLEENHVALYDGIWWAITQKHNEVVAFRVKENKKILMRWGGSEIDRRCLQLLNGCFEISERTDK